MKKLERENLNLNVLIVNKNGEMLKYKKKCGDLK